MNYHKTQGNYKKSKIWFLSVSKTVEEGIKLIRVPKVSAQHV